VQPDNPIKRKQRLQWIESLCETALGLASKKDGQPLLLQIGANDGKQDDLVSSFIKRSKIRAVLLEPVPSIYEELVENYEGYDNVKCYNCGIADHTGKKNIITVDYEGFCKSWESKWKTSPPVWAKGLSTYDETKNCLGESFGIEATNEEIRAFKTEVETDVFTLPDFLNAHGVDGIDIYVSDAEGYDYLIFNQLDLNQYAPFLIIAETHTCGPEKVHEIHLKLEKHGYTSHTNVYAWDTVATKIL